MREVREFHGNKKMQDCCEISQELRVTLDRLKNECGTLRGKAMDRDFA
jgi:hypothetical protein